MSGSLFTKRPLMAFRDKEWRSRLKRKRNKGHMRAMRLAQLGQ